MSDVSPLDIGVSHSAACSAAASAVARHATTTEGSSVESTSSVEVGLVRGAVVPAKTPVVQTMEAVGAAVMSGDDSNKDCGVGSSSADPLKFPAPVGLKRTLSEIRADEAETFTSYIGQWYSARSNNAPPCVLLAGHCNLFPINHT